MLNQLCIVNGFVDQALLAEAPPQLPWPSTNRGTGLSGGRLSLPGHTAPCSLSLDSFEKRKMPARQRGQCCGRLCCANLT